MQTLQESPGTVDQLHTTRKERCGERGQTYIVTHEEVIRIGGVTTDSKKLDKVIELAVDIAADGNGAFHGLNVPFLDEDGLSLIAERPHILLR